MARFDRPLTFQDRGMTAPFVSAMLIGVRIRPSARGGIEMVMPNPSGRRGVYITPWDDIQGLCQPTVHDTVLYRRLGQTSGLVPETVRRVAWEIAAEGLGGAAARRAAALAKAADEAEHLLASFLLLISLIEEVDPTGLIIDAQIRRTPALEERARAALGTIASGMSWSRAAVIGEIDALGRHFAPVGVERSDSRARLRVLLTRVQALACSLRAWLDGRDNDDAAGLARTLADAASLAAEASDATLSGIHDQTRDMRGLLRRWRAHPDTIAEHIGRLAWVLDGWEAICLMWELPVMTPNRPGDRGTDRIRDRSAVLRAMARLIPALPCQISDWTGYDFGANTPERSVPGFPSVESAARTLAAVTRNEHLRAAYR